MEDYLDLHHRLRAELVRDEDSSTDEDALTIETYRYFEEHKNSFEWNERFQTLVEKGYFRRENKITLLSVNTNSPFNSNNFVWNLPMKHQRFK
jgi:hypothetical protein